MPDHHFVMWWVEPGQQPSLAEAMERLDHLRQHGASDRAFGWSHLQGAGAGAADLRQQTLPDDH